MSKKKTSHFLSPGGNNGSRLKLNQVSAKSIQKSNQTVKVKKMPIVTENAIDYYDQKTCGPHCRKTKM